MPIEYIGTSDLVWKNDTRISTFPSGLVLVQRTASCRKSDNKRAEIDLLDPLVIDNSPTIDGQFIFPVPQSKENGPWLDYDVSAYGRTSDIPRTVLEPTMSVMMQAGTFSLSITGQKIKGYMVVEANSPAMPPMPTTPPTFEVVYNGVTYTLITNWDLDSFQRTNYGYFDEVVYSFTVKIDTSGLTLP
jgi:hypothetical protein